MRTENINTNIYTYDELSDKAKEEARAWYRRASDGDNFFSEHVIEDAVECANILGISINTRRGSSEPAVYWSGFWSQGDGASFEGSWRYAKGSTKAIRKHAPSDTTLHGIADRLAYAAKKTFYMVSAEVACATSHYSHSGCMQVEVRMEINAHNEEVEEEITQALRDFADWIYRQLEKGYEYQNSDEVVAENIIANEYEFTENGNKH